jgi:hypothetical protein
MLTKVDRGPPYFHTAVQKFLYQRFLTEICWHRQSYNLGHLVPLTLHQ